MGTGDLTQGPAMEREEAVRALETGIRLARRLAKQGYRAIATGEMGIGNTTTSAAVAAVLLERDPAEVTGVGAGLPAAGSSGKWTLSGAALRATGRMPAILWMYCPKSVDWIWQELQALFGRRLRRRSGGN